jgi:hypothetical protein
VNVSTPNINLFDLTPEQLKRAASIKERIDGLNKQLRGIHIASFAMLTRTEDGQMQLLDQMICHGHGSKYVKKLEPPAGVEPATY